MTYLQIMDLEAIFNSRNLLPPIEDPFWMRIKWIWTGNRVYNSSHYYSEVSFKLNFQYKYLSCLLLWISGRRQNAISLIVTGNKVNIEPDIFLEYWKFCHFTFSKDWFCFKAHLEIISNQSSFLYRIAKKPMYRIWI